LKICDQVDINRILFLKKVRKMAGTKNQFSTAKPEAKDEIEELKNLVKKKKIQNSVLQKLLKNLNKLEHNHKN
jgi:hypothetical protein